jgi:hypothetical protein
LEQNKTNASITVYVKVPVVATLHTLKFPTTPVQGLHQAFVTLGYNNCTPGRIELGNGQLG